MNPGNLTVSDPDQQAHQHAIGLLRAGEIEQGVRLLQDIATRTRDAELRALCDYNRGETLEQIGQIVAAYELWYRQAHQPPSQLARADLLARLKVMRLFEIAGLQLRVPDFPPKVQIEVTNRCNLRCIMCTRNQMRRPAADMSLEHFRNVAADCSGGPGCVVQLFFLGEPLLHPQLEEMVAYLDSVKSRPPLPLNFGIQTNAMLLTKDRARELINAGLRNFTCSVDGLEGDLERIRPGAEYAVVERNILDLVALREELGLSDLTIEITKLCDDPNAEEVKRFQARWAGKVDRVLLAGITKLPGNEYMGADGEVRATEPEECVLGRRYCGQGQRLLVHADGHYAFCCSDVNGELGLGHVDERSIAQVWKSPEIEYIRRKIIAADYAGLAACERCPLSRA